MRPVSQRNTNSSYINGNEQHLSRCIGASPDCPTAVLYTVFSQYRTHKSTDQVAEWRSQSIKELRRSTEQVPLLSVECGIRRQRRPSTSPALEMISRYAMLRMDSRPERSFHGCWDGSPKGFATQRHFGIIRHRVTAL